MKTVEMPNHEMLRRFRKGCLALAVKRFLPASGTKAKMMGSRYLGLLALICSLKPALLFAAADLTVGHLHVTQAVQDKNNVVTLVAKRSTAVRATLSYVSGAG